MKAVMGFTETILYSLAGMSSFFCLMMSRSLPLMSLFILSLELRLEARWQPKDMDRLRLEAIKIEESRRTDQAAKCIKRIRNGLQ